MSFITLEDILGKDSAELQAVAQGEFKTEKLGLIPFSALGWDEYKEAKKDCAITVTEKGKSYVKIDNEKLTVRTIVMAVDKDPRSNFTFCNAELLKKLEVLTADAAVEKLLNPGEIFSMSQVIEHLSGFGVEVTEEEREAVKNS